MPTSVKSKGYEGGKSVAEKLAPGPKATKAAKTTPPPSHSGGTSGDLTIPEYTPETPTGAPYEPSEPGTSKRDFAKAERGKRRKERRHSEAKVDRITAALDFVRSRRATAFEQDKFSEITDKYFERNPDGSVKTHSIQVPVIKTSPAKIKEDEQKYHKVVHHFKLSGASPRAVHLLGLAAANKVITDNYSIGHNGKVATVPEDVPSIKPGKQAEFHKEVAAAQDKLHAVREGASSYKFQSDVSHNEEIERLKHMEAEHTDGGILGNIPGVGGYLEGVVSDPLGALDQVIAPVPTAVAKHVFGLNLTDVGEKEVGSISKGIAEVNRTLSASQQLQDAQVKASGIPVLENIPDLRIGAQHGIHTGVLTGTEYLTRPGGAIESVLGHAIGVHGASPLEVLLHGHKAKHYISGGKIAKRLTGHTQGGLVIDFLTDPTLWVGAGEVKLATGERLAALSDRFERAGLDISQLSGGVPGQVLKGMETGDAGDILTRMEDIAEREGISVSKLGATADDKKAVKAWKGFLNQQQGRTAKGLGDKIASAAREDIKAANGRVNVARDRLAAAEKGGDKEAIRIRSEELSNAVSDAAKLESQGKYAMGGAERGNAADETVRVANEAQTVPGVRINIQTPLGRHLTHVDVKLPDKYAEGANVIPDFHLSPKMREENQKELEGLRRSKLDREVLKAYDPQLRDAEKAVKDAKTPAESAAANDTLDELMAKLHEDRSAAKDSISKSRFKTPAEHAATRSARRLAHDLNRISATAGSSSVFHRAFANMHDAMDGLNEAERQSVGLHMAEYADTGGRSISHRIAPLDAKGERALAKMKVVNYELGKFGVESGTIDKLMQDYAYRHVVKEGDALGPGIEGTAAERASTMKAAGNPSKARGYAATAEVSGRVKLAEQLEKLAHGGLSRDEALHLADEWHESGKVRMLQEDMIHAFQRDHHTREHELTPSEHNAMSWGRGRQKEDGKPMPDLFKDLEKTEGIVKPTDDAFHSHNFEEDPFGHMTEKEANQLKHATAQGDLNRLKEAHASAERGSYRDDLGKIIERREAEVAGYKQILDPKRKMTAKVKKRLEKLEELRDRPGTPGEGAAAQEAINRLKANAHSRLGTEPDYGDFIPQSASKEYLGSLKDFRANHPEQFTVLDPTLANYHRSLRESIKSAYTMRWRAADRSFGRDANDPRLRSPDGRIYYDKHTGEEFIHADPNVFKGAIKQGRLLPTRLHADLKSEFWRMGENVAHDLFDDVNAGLFSKLSSMTRFTLTTYFPAYHMRNMISDSLNSLLADPGVMFHPVMNAKLASRSMGRSFGGKGMQKLMDVPGFDQPITTESYLFMMETMGLKNQEHLAEFVKAADDGQLADHKWWKTNPAGRKAPGGQWALRMSAHREDIIRMQTFLQRMRRNGGDAADAAWHTIKYHFDYSDLSQWEKRYMRNAFLFYTWYRKNIPLQFLSIIQKPGFFSALTNGYIDLAQGETPFNANWNKINPLLPDLSGPVPNSALVPDYMTRIMAAPVVNWNGHATAFSLGLPWADMNLVTNALENPEEGIRSIANMTTPLIRAGFELGSGTSLLTGQHLEGDENSTWTNLLAKAGVHLPEDDEGRPIMPWQTSAILNNLFPAVGRGAGYLKPPSSVEDQGRFNSLFGGGAGTFGTGVSVTMTPKEGERLDKAYIYKVYERALAREAVINSGKKDSEKEADLKKFDEQTAEWAVQTGVPKKYLKVVQGLGSKWFVSQSDKKVATETGILGNEEGGISGTSGGSILGGGTGEMLGHESDSAKAKKYKSRTEEALNLLGDNEVKGQGFTGFEGTKSPSKYGLEGALNFLHKSEKEEHEPPREKPVVADAQHRGVVPDAGPRAKSRTAPVVAKKEKAPVAKPTEQATVKLLEENGASPQVAAAAAKRMGPKGWQEAAEVSAAGYGNKSTPQEKAAKKERHLAVATYHHIKDKVENEGLPQFSGFSNPSQEQFAQWFTKYSGMDPEFVGNWVAAEGGGSADGGAGGAGVNNWLGVRYPAETTHDSETHMNGTPKQAAKESVEWMYGEGPTQWDEHSAESIRGFKQLADEHAPASELAEYLAGGSRWGTGSISLDNIQYTGSTGVDPANKKALAKTEAKLEALGVNPAKLDNHAEGGFTVPYKAFGKHVRKDLRKVTHSPGYQDETSTKPITIHGPNGGTVIREVQGSSGVASVINKGQDPEITARLLLLSAKTGKTINILSAYRTPSQSENVGGFADDPHTKGEAMDIGVEGATIDSANSISEAEYESVGLYRPYGTAHGGSSAEDNHVQLLNGGSPATAGYVAGSTGSSAPVSSSGASGAPVSAPGTSAPASGATGQENKGYHPGRSAEAVKAAKEMRGNIKGAFGLAGGSFTFRKTPEVQGPNLLGYAAKIRAEVEATKKDSAVTHTTKRKPKFKV